jgi:predicted amidohydrolase
MRAMQIAIAQFNPTVGDLDGNAGRLADLAWQADAKGATLLLAPELALCGYPPEDLALQIGRAHV